MFFIQTTFGNQKLKAVDFEYSLKNISSFANCIANIIFLLT